MNSIIYILIAYFNHILFLDNIKYTANTQFTFNKEVHFFHYQRIIHQEVLVLQLQVVVVPERQPLLLPHVAHAVLGPSEPHHYWAVMGHFLLVWLDLGALVEAWSSSGGEASAVSWTTWVFFGTATWSTMHTGDPKLSGEASVIFSDGIFSELNFQGKAKLIIFFYSFFLGQKLSGKMEEINKPLRFKVLNINR